jgi:quercetin dioxygenase-like cupin family protein
MNTHLQSGAASGAGLAPAPDGDPAAIWFLGTLAFVRASAESANGGFGLVENVMPPGFESPYHLHHNEDEGFYVLEGHVTFILDGRKSKAGPGAFVFGPRGIPHGFRVEGNAPARILLMAVPGGFEKFVVEMGEPAAAPVLPPPAPPDMAKLMTLAAKYGIDILGPLPE